VIERLAGAAAAARAGGISAVLITAYAEPGQQWSPATVRATVEHPGTVAVLVESGCAIIRVAADEAELLTIAVEPARRLRGLGSALLAEVIAAAAAGGATRLFLEVAADNAPGLALYRSRGFTEVGRRRGYYPRADARADALIMARHLDPGEN